MNALHIVDLVSDAANKEYVPAGRMVAAICEVFRDKGKRKCTEIDLLKKGFGLEEVKERFSIALALAEFEFDKKQPKPKRPGLSWWRK